MKIAILTMFNGLSTTYSLVNVVENHINIFLNNNIDVKILVSEDCSGEKFGAYKSDKLEWVNITNRLNGKQIHWRDYTQSFGVLHESFCDEVECIKEDFIDALQDVDFCFMHDILYQGWHYVHNIAIREAQKSLPNVKFVSFTHSFPIPRPSKISEKFNGRFTSMPNTVFAYPTECGLNALAYQYNVDKKYCYPIYNSNPLLLNVSDEVKSISKQVDLFSPEILIIYPARLTTAKQNEKIAILAGAIRKTFNKSIKIIFCDFPAMDTNSETYKKDIISIGLDNGLIDGDIVFTTDLGFENGLRRESVLDLFTLSNLYICPSFSESFGLTVLEASSRGNFIVLNEAVPALKELGNNLNAYFMRWNAKNFGFDTTEHYHPNETAYNIDNAKKIIENMDNNSVINAKTKARTMYNDNWIWENQIKTILYKDN